MKTAVEAILVGKDRLYNRRFLQMCSHYLVDPATCTPASGWEKGQVENEVGLPARRLPVCLPATVSPSPAMVARGWVERTANEVRSSYVQRGECRLAI